MLKIHFSDNAAGPLIVCDSCGDPINDHRKGIASYTPQTKPDQTVDCYHVHKGECDAHLKARLGVARTKWQDLRAHLQFLCLNVRLTPRKMEMTDLDRMMAN